MTASVAVTKMKAIVGAWVLIAFVGVLQVQAPQALLNIVERVSDLSFDDPASQARDELAGETASTAEPFGEARGSSRLACSLSQPVSEHVFFPALRRVALSNCITRSPPLV